MSCGGTGCVSRRITSLVPGRIHIHGSSLRIYSKNPRAFSSGHPCKSISRPCPFSDRYFQRLRASSTLDSTCIFSSEFHPWRREEKELPDKQVYGAKTHRGKPVYTTYPISATGIQTREGRANVAQLVWTTHHYHELYMRQVYETRVHRVCSRTST